MDKYEDSTTEFKLLLTKDLEREVVAFLNSKSGGDIYIGVDDNSYVVGIENPDETQLLISDRIKNNILPVCLGLFDVLLEEAENKNIIHIVVTRGTEKPYYLKKYGMTPAGCFIRIGSGIQQMTTGMINDLYSSRTRYSLRKIISPRFNNHSFSQLKIYYEGKGVIINNSFLQNLDLFTDEGSYNYIAYLLADVNSVSLKVAKYAGIDKQKLIENEEYGYCSLIKATESNLIKVDTVQF